MRQYLSVTQLQTQEGLCAHFYKRLSSPMQMRRYQPDDRFPQPRHHHSSTKRHRPIYRHHHSPPRRNHSSPRHSRSPIRHRHSPPRHHRSTRRPRRPLTRHSRSPIRHHRSSPRRRRPLTKHHRSLTSRSRSPTRNEDSYPSLPCLPVLCSLEERVVDEVIQHWFHDDWGLGRSILKVIFTPSNIIHAEYDPTDVTFDEAVPIEDSDSLKLFIDTNPLLFDQCISVYSATETENEEDSSRWVNVDIGHSASTLNPPEARKLLKVECVKLLRATKLQKDVSYQVCSSIHTPHGMLPVRTTHFGTIIY